MRAKLRKTSIRSVRTEPVSGGRGSPRPADGSVSASSSSSFGLFQRWCRAGARTGRPRGEAGGDRSGGGPTRCVYPSPPAPRCSGGAEGARGTRRLSAQPAGRVRDYCSARCRASPTAALARAFSASASLVATSSCDSALSWCAEPSRRSESFPTIVPVASLALPLTSSTTPAVHARIGPNHPDGLSSARRTFCSPNGLMRVIDRNWVG